MGPLATGLSSSVRGGFFCRSRRIPLAETILSGAKGRGRKAGIHSLGAGALANRVAAALFFFGVQPRQGSVGRPTRVVGDAGAKKSP